MTKFKVGDKVKRVEDIKHPFTVDKIYTVTDESCSCGGGEIQIDSISDYRNTWWDAEYFDLVEEQKVDQLVDFVKWFMKQPTLTHEFDAVLKAIKDYRNYKNPEYAEYLRLKEMFE